MFQTAEIFHLTLSVHLHSLFPTMIRESILFLGVYNSFVQLLLHNKHIPGLSLKTKEIKCFLLFETSISA